MLFNNELTNEQIAKKLHCSSSTLYKWKRDNTFKLAQEQYARVVVKDYKNDALKKVHELLNARSEMVQLQSATTILKMAATCLITQLLNWMRLRFVSLNAEAKTKSMNENGDRVAETNQGFSNVSLK